MPELVPEDQGANHNEEDQQVRHAACDTGAHTVKPRL